MKPTQLYRKHWSFSITLRDHDVNLAREYFMEDKSTLLCFDFPWNFTAPAVSVGVFSMKIDFYSFCWVFHQFVDVHAVHVRRKNLSLNFSAKVADEVQNELVKSFQQRSGLLALLKISARCRRWTQLNGRLVRHDCRLPDGRSEQNYRHVTELICSQAGNTGSSRSQRKMIKLTAKSLISGCCEKLSWTQTRHR